MLKLFGHPPGVRPIKTWGISCIVSDKAMRERNGFDWVKYLKELFTKQMIKKGRVRVSRFSTEIEREDALRATRFTVKAKTQFVGKRKAARL